MLKKIAKIGFGIILVLFLFWPTSVVAMSLLGIALSKIFGTNVAVIVWLIGVSFVTLFIWVSLFGMKRRRAIILPSARVEIDAMGRRRIQKPDKAVIIEFEDVA